MLRLGWFSTGRGEGSRGLLRMAVEAIGRGELDATIESVFSNREPGEAEGSDRYFDLVHECGFPLVTYSSRRFRQEYGTRVVDNREAFDREVLQRLQGFQPDLCVLAGYMLIVGPELCRRYTMINLHPALPSGPKGTWQEVIWQLIDQGAPETGAMVHLVTEVVDEGPPITYVRFPIRGEPFRRAWGEVVGRSVQELREAAGEKLPLFRLIREEGVRRERPLLLETLKAFARGQVSVVEGRVVAQEGEVPLCLNPQVGQALAASGGR